MEKKDVKTLEEFDQLINDNKVSNKHWNSGIKDKQLREMSESNARNYFVKLEEEKALVDKIVLASTWNINCGIATYTKYLFDSLDKVVPGLFVINPVNEGSLKYKTMGRLTHLQHEFGIVTEPPKIMGKLIITWHTVPDSIDDIMELFESELNVVAHIVHCKDALNYINTKRDVYVVKHGSASIKEIKKEDARKILNINDMDMPIGFVFGFQSQNKLYGELINMAKNNNIHIMISGSQHESGHIANLSNNKNVTFLGRHLTEEEIDLHASASDLLLFDYTSQDHYSCSGAMHRIIGAGKPVICSNTKHFTDVTDKKNVLKFNNQKELGQCIRTALTDSTRLGKAAREYAKDTSWENMAKRHMEIYREYVDL